MTRYRGNTQAVTSQRELEILKQGEKEGFTAYLARWREIAAQMVTTPPEAELVKIFISNLLPKYKDHLKYLRLDTFNKVYHIGIEIEDDLNKESNKSKWGGNRRNDNNKPSSSSHNINAIETPKAPFRRRREYTALGMTYTQAFERLHSKGKINPVGPTPDPAPEKKVL